ncbi:MAG: DUF3089 domain-containing protein [Chitinophagaceae bacterium]
MIMVISSCKPAYYSFIGQYKTEFQKKEDSIPDYSQLKYWAAHPWKKDPSDSIPLPFINEERDSSVDVFFIHPTTLTDKKSNGIVWNASVDDAELNAKTDYTSILYQASVFNQHARIFAPRYRQAHLYSFFTTDKAKGVAALSLAYEDIKKSFEYYLAHYNHGRPIIIASHSQGTVHAARLLKEYFEIQPRSNQLVCAYLIGMYLPRNYFSAYAPCKDSASTGCFVGWRTFRRNYTAPYVETETEPCWVVNPLSWTSTEQRIDKSNNTGAVLYNYNRMYRHTNDAQIHKGVLWISRPKFPFSFLYRSKNYHPGDINLFYKNVRTNVDTRIKAYFHQKTG